MFKLNKLPLLIFSLLGYLTVLFTFSGSVTPAYGQDSVNAIPSLGKGKYEIVMFTDYFCPPCKRIDTKAEPLFKELLATGQVKITFVDVPFSRATPVYAKYYLYAGNVNADADSILHIRNLLFDAAQNRNIQTEEALIAYLKEQKISWKIFDEKSTLSMMSDIIKKNMVANTPSCIIKYSAKDVKKYIGDDQIWDALTKLKAHLVTLKK